MDSSSLLCHLHRIDSLADEGAPAAVVLDEIRSLLAEAEPWAATTSVGSGERARVRRALDRAHLHLERRDVPTLAC